MRSFDSLDIRARRKILARYVANEITLDDVETEYDVSADSLLAYLENDVAAKIQERKPPVKTTVGQDLKVIFKAVTDNLLADFLVKASLIFLLFRACVDVPKYLANSTTPLGSLVIEKAGLALLAYLIGKVFFDVFSLFTDRKEFKYASAFIHRSFGYDIDFQTLTPFQRCLLSIAKRSVRMLVYGLLFLGILMQ
ncbi:MAG: hypothetical protein U0X91_30770 [Spirosomataceae bacterium]